MFPFVGVVEMDFGQFFNLVQTVEKGVAVQMQLSGGLRHVAVIAKVVVKCLI